MDATEACPSRSIALFSFRQTSSTMMAEMKFRQMQEVIWLKLHKAQGWVTAFSPTMAQMMSRMHISRDEFLVDLEPCPLVHSVNLPQRKSDYAQFKIIHENIEWTLKHISLSSWSSLSSKMRGLLSSSFDIVQLHALFYICLVLLLVYQCFDISNCQGLFPVVPILSPFKEI